MKQTAVEWLLEELLKGYFEQQQIAIKQAKQMEKQQIIDAYDVQWVENIKNGEDYYNETFKNK
jgi:hypothetical protein